jgi:hypothetical protein
MKHIYGLYRHSYVVLMLMQVAHTHTHTEPLNFATSLYHAGHSLTAAVFRTSIKETIWNFHSLSRVAVNNLNTLKPRGYYIYTYVCIYISPGLTFNNSTFCAHSVFISFVWLSEQTAIISLYSSYSSVFRRVRKIGKSDYQLRHVCLSVTWNNGFSIKFYIWVFFGSLSRKFKFQ